MPRTTKRTEAQAAPYPQSPSCNASGCYFLSLTSCIPRPRRCRRPFSRRRLRRSHCASPPARGLLRGLLFRVHLLAQLLRRGGQRLRLGVDAFPCRRFSALPRLPSARSRSWPSRRPQSCRRIPPSDFFTECTSASAWLRAVTSSSAFLSSSACASASLHHALDLGLVQARARLDLDLVLLAGRLVLGATRAGCRWRRCRR